MILCRSEDGRRASTTPHQSMPDQAPMYALLILALGVVTVGVTLVGLAYLLLF
jgi:hypothetical protein